MIFSALPLDESLHEQLRKRDSPIMQKLAYTTFSHSLGQERTSIFVFIWLASKLFPAHLLAPLD